MNNETALWDSIRSENDKWSLDNFGEQPAHQPLLGLFEELGELQLAWAMRNSKEVEDSLGDCAIFLASFCTRIGEPEMFSKVMTIPKERAERLLRIQPNGEKEPGAILLHMAGISHSFLKMEQGIRGGRDEHVKDIMYHLFSIVEHLYLTSFHARLDLPSVAKGVWDRVKKRNWKADPHKGGEQDSKHE